MNIKANLPTNGELKQHAASFWQWLAGIMLVAIFAMQAATFKTSRANSVDISVIETQIEERTLDRFTAREATRALANIDKTFSDHMIAITENRMRIRRLEREP